MNPLYLSLIPSFIKSFKIHWEKTYPIQYLVLGVKVEGEEAHCLVFQVHLMSAAADYVLVNYC